MNCEPEDGQIQRFWAFQVVKLMVEEAKERGLPMVAIAEAMPIEVLRNDNLQRRPEFFSSAKYYLMNAGSNFADN